MKVEFFSFLVEKSYNKTVIDFNFGRHEDLSSLKSDIHLGVAASVNYLFSGRLILMSTSLKSILVYYLPLKVIFTLALRSDGDYHFFG